MWEALKKSRSVRSMFVGLASLVMACQAPTADAPPALTPPTPPSISVPPGCESEISLLEKVEPERREKLRTAIQMWFDRTRSLAREPASCQDVRAWLCTFIKFSREVSPDGRHSRACEIAMRKLVDDDAGCVDLFKTAVARNAQDEQREGRVAAPFYCMTGALMPMVALMMAVESLEGDYPPRDGR